MTTINNQALSHGIDVVTWGSSKPGTFREQFSIRIDPAISFLVGMGLNGASVAWDRGRMEFNPNKVATTKAFKTVHAAMIASTRVFARYISRFDLAVDIPVERENCFLVKDRRMYIERRHGKELTQYLGSKSSKVGRVKLYNKKLEAKLDFPLTRLELTLDPKTKYEDNNFPVVYVTDGNSIREAGLKVTDTDRFILEAVVQGFGALDRLGRKTRAKIEKLLENYIRKIEIPAESYAEILAQLEEYLS